MPSNITDELKLTHASSESVSIPVNPRTSRPVGYAFVDLSAPSEAERAISELNGQTILDRKVSIQLARKPEAHGEGATSGGEGSGTNRRRPSQRGRGRGRGRGGRSVRGGRGVCYIHLHTASRALANVHQARKGQTNGTAVTEEAATNGPTNVPGQVKPLVDTTNESLTAEKDPEATAAADAEKTPKPRSPRERKQRGPPEDGVPSKTKVMVANLPYDLGEEKVIYSPEFQAILSLTWP